MTCQKFRSGALWSRIFGLCLTYHFIPKNFKFCREKSYFEQPKTLAKIWTFHVELTNRVNISNFRRIFHILSQNGIFASFHHRFNFFEHLFKMCLMYRGDAFTIVPLAYKISAKMTQSHSIASPLYFPTEWSFFSIFFAEMASIHFHRESIIFLNSRLEIRILD